MNTLAFLKDAARLVSLMSPGKALNLCRLEFSYYLSRITGKVIHHGCPSSISIEPTAFCNLRCPECPTGRRKLKRPTGSISREFFQSVIDQLSPELMYLNMYFQGEPFLHPDFFRMVKYAGSARIYTSASTNGHFLSEDNCRETIQSGLNRLIISLDGADQATYEQYRAGGDLETVKSGIRRMVGLKEELHSGTPFIIAQFIVFATNEHQIKEIRNLARELGVDRLEIKTAQLIDLNEGNRMVPKNPGYSRYRQDESGHYVMKHPLRNHCRRMWTSSVITWDGMVVPCCFDKDAGHILGDLKTSSFTDIWSGDEYRRFRREILSRRGGIDICRNCTER